MENQHRKIKGYRELSQVEIDLMNEIKQKGEELGELIKKVEGHLTQQQQNAVVDSISTDGGEEVFRLLQAEPMRWCKIAQTDMQQGIMFLIRSVAQPTTF